MTLEKIFTLGRTDLYRRIRSMMPHHIGSTWPDEAPPIGSTMHYILRAVTGLIEEARREMTKGRSA